MEFRWKLGSLGAINIHSLVMTLLNTEIELYLLREKHVVNMLSQNSSVVIDYSEGNLLVIQVISLGECVVLCTFPGKIMTEN